jgi:predicted negative regulator of RcsB-dependent stress response
MTWEWVTLILGTILLIVVLFGWIAWTQMNARIIESYPKTLPDLMVRSQAKQKEEEHISGGP